MLRGMKRKRVFTALALALQAEMDFDDGDAIITNKFLSLQQSLCWTLENDFECQKNIQLQLVWLNSNIIANDHFRIPLFFEHWIDKYLECDFFTHFRLSRKSFDLLVNEIGKEMNDVYKIHSGGCLEVPLSKSVLLTLWMLAKGDTLVSTADRFDIAVSTCHSVTGIVISALADLRHKFIIWPTKRECVTLSEEFENLCGYPGIIGAIDGTDISCKVPQNQHDSYQNRKCFHSIKIQGVCTAKKYFINIFVGFPGSTHDARVLKESILFKDISQKGPTAYFYNQAHHLIGDSAYPCLPWLLTPYRDFGRLTAHQKAHNYKLSRSRVAIEHCFGSLKCRWRIMQHINVYSIKKAIYIATACCVLHNFCYLNEDEFNDMPHENNFEDNADTVYGCPLPDEKAGLEKRKLITDYLL